MKKAFILCAALAAGIAVQVQANVIPSNNGAITVVQDDKVRIEADQLPETVQTALAGDEYRGWMVDAAYFIKSKENYEVELKNGAESKTITFNKEGKKVE
jgi:hypothetical protein